MGSVEKIAKDIKNLKIQGARSIALTSLKVLREVAKKEGFNKNFDRYCKILVSSRPTAVALYNALEELKKEKTMDKLDNLIYYFENVSSMIAWHGYKLIKNNFTVLTHCHSSVVVEIFRKAKGEKRNFKVMVTETRPLYQGRITAKELSKAGIPVIYVDDSAPGYFVNDIIFVLMGTDSIRKEGVVNKIGSYLYAVLAKENKIPVYFAGEIMKIDRRKNFVIEERNPKEIIEPKLMRGNVRIENPAFDITPFKYVTGLVTERGIMKPNKIKAILDKSL